jgi:transcriptional regulator with XRE-family HTH domain
MTIGQRIREKRNEAGRKMTLKQLADVSELSVTYLSDVERGATRPSLKTLGRIAEAFGITTTDLMHGVDELGEATSEALPPGLRELRGDPEYAKLLDDDWVRTLVRVDYKGRRPQTKHDWLEMFLSLRRILAEPDRRR